MQSRNLLKLEQNLDARHLPLLLCSPKLIASDRSWFYCSHMTWVEPCGFMKEQILFCTNVENGTALGAQNDFIFEIER